MSVPDMNADRMSAKFGKHGAIRLSEQDASEYRGAAATSKA